MKFKFNKFYKTFLQPLSPFLLYQPPTTRSDENKTTPVNSRQQPHQTSSFTYVLTGL